MMEGDHNRTASEDGGFHKVRDDHNKNTLSEGY